MKKELPTDHFNVVCSIIARNHSLSTGNPLPSELLNFRNARNTIHKHTISVKETFIEGEHKFKSQVEFKDQYNGVAKINGTSYDFTFKEVAQNILEVIVNNQVRRVEYFTKNNTVYLFDSQGDSTGYKFETDFRKEKEE